MGPQVQLQVGGAAVCHHQPPVFPQCRAAHGAPWSPFPSILIKHSIWCSWWAAGLLSKRSAPHPLLGKPGRGGEAGPAFQGKTKSAFNRPDQGGVTGSGRSARVKLCCTNFASHCCGQVWQLHCELCYNSLLPFQHSSFVQHCL